MEEITLEVKLKYGKLGKTHKYTTKILVVDSELEKLKSNHPIQDMIERISAYGSGVLRSRLGISKKNCVPSVNHVINGNIDDFRMGPYQQSLSDKINEIIKK